MPELDGLIEPNITINGVPLTFAEALTLRVAIGNFAISLSDPTFRRDVGEVLARNYAERLDAIQRLITGPIRK